MATHGGTRRHVNDLDHDARRQPEPIAEIVISSGTYHA